MLHKNILVEWKVTETEEYIRFKRSENVYRGFNVISLRRRNKLIVFTGTVLRTIR